MPRRGENIRKRKDGRWEGRYISKREISGKAKYTSVYGKTYSEVKQKLIFANRQKSIDIHPPTQMNICLKELLFLWLEDNKVKLKISTYSKYLRLIENHILPSLGNILIKNIDATVINKFLREKSTAGNLSGKGGLSASTVRTIGFILKSAINYGYKNNYCSCINGEVILPLKSNQTLNVLNITEQVRLENSCLDDNNEQKIGILLSLYTGLRLGEICGLKWSDIDYEGKTIHIHRTVERIENITSPTNSSKTSLMLLDVKTSSSDRVIPIPSKLFPLVCNKKDGFVIQGRTYEYMDPRTLQYYFKKKLKEADIEDMKFHCLRHTFATRCIESGMDIKSLSEIMGHSDVNITLRTYVHSSMEHKRNQMEAMINICGQN